MQAGIDAAEAAEAVGHCQVWVAKGTYFVYSASPTDSIRLAEGVDVYGGFDPDDTSFDERDWVLNETVLDGRDSDPGTRRVQHVVIGADGVVFDGFKVRYGEAAGDTTYGQDRGGGMYNPGTSPLVRNCAFSSNRAKNEGGGVFCSGGEAQFLDCTFMDNSAGAGGGVAILDSAAVTVSGGSVEANSSDSSGGGIYVEGSAATITHVRFYGNEGGDGGGLGVSFWSGAHTVNVEKCTFEANQAAYGGAVFHASSSGNPMSVALTDCILNGNTATVDGGGVESYFGSPVMTNCLFYENIAATGNGGAIRNYKGSPQIINCTVAEHTAETGKGGGFYNAFDANVEVTNSVFWFNSPGEIVHETGSALVTYSNVRGAGAAPLLHNIDQDPNFVSRDDDDYRLGDLSACIDAADDKEAPAVDLTGNGRTDIPGIGDSGVVADMGAIEFVRPCVRYVRADGLWNGDATSWATAEDDVDDAVFKAYEATQAPSGPQKCEVWVAQGVYHIYSGAPSDTVKLYPNVELYGGFAGESNEVFRSQRDAKTRPTILDGRSSAVGSNRVYHVVEGAEGAVLDGFTVRYGMAADEFGPDNKSGAGLYNDLYGSEPMLVRNCVFSDNTASLRGAAMFTGGGNVSAENCIFKDNEVTDAASFGGAVANFWTTSARFVNCVFAGNTSAHYGGAMRNMDAEDVSLTNCTLYGNAGPSGGGAIQNYNSTTAVTNSILFGNTPDAIVHAGTSGVTVTCSNVEGGYSGMGNFEGDPDFLDAPGYDFHIGSLSACIDQAVDSAAPKTDIEGNDRVDIPSVGDSGTRADVGAYEYQGR